MPADAAEIVRGVERVLASQWTALFAFTLLLGTFHLSTWQAFLAVLVFIQRTTPPAGWLVAERRARAAQHDNEVG